MAARLSAATTASAGAGRERGGDELVAVAVVAGDREERLARRDAAAVDRDAGDGGRQRPGRLGTAWPAPSPRRSRRALMPIPSPASAAATASWSLNGSTCLPTIWPVSWPLPAISRTSPRAQLARSRCGSPRRGRRSRPRPAPPAGSRRGSRLASSLRGLSSVTMTRSAFSAAICAHHRPLARIAVAAGAEHHDQAAGHIGPQRLERLGERVGLVGVVDEDRRAVLLAHQLEPALGALEPRSAAKTAAGSPPVAIASPAATSAFSTWKSPTSGSRSR